MSLGTQIPPVDALTFTVTNVGRRPVTLVGFYGFLKWQGFNRLVSWLLEKRTPEFFGVRAFFLPQPIILQQLRPHGKNPTLQEGDSIQISVQGQAGIDLAKSISQEAGSLYISDTTGRRFWAPRKILRNLREDVRKYHG